MKPSLWQRLDVLARQLTPFGITFALVIINAVPLHVPALSRVIPVLPLMAIYHWGIFRPNLMPMIAVFGIGLFHDLIAGYPLGVHALVFVTVNGVVISQRRFIVGKTFAIYWLGFALAALGAGVETWLAMSILNMSLVEPTGAASQYLLTVGMFPPLAWLLMRWQQAFLKQE
jgi:rod shape-determining protein MreD